MSLKGLRTDPRGGKRPLAVTRTGFQPEEGTCMVILKNRRFRFGTT
jgi:hypothetical protein